MKKIYLLLAMLCMAFTSSIPAAADDLAMVERDGIHYSLKGKNGPTGIVRGRPQCETIIKTIMER